MLSDETGRILKIKGDQKVLLHAKQNNLDVLRNVRKIKWELMQLAWQLIEIKQSK
jgi:hypothetical protein